MWLIGLTGGIGSGKSSVARWFGNRKIPVLDADAMVHRMLAEDARTLAAIRETFGTDVISERGAVDRSRLGRLVFSDTAARKSLENIIYPRLEILRQGEIKDLEKSGQPLCVWDVPLLFENGLEVKVQESVLVWVPREIQVLRVAGRESWPEKEILARINAQMPMAEKLKLADVVIDNSSMWTETESQLEKYWESLVARNIIPATEFRISE